MFHLHPKQGSCALRYRSVHYAMSLNDYVPSTRLERMIFLQLIDVDGWYSCLIMLSRIFFANQCSQWVAMLDKEQVKKSRSSMYETYEGFEKVDKYIYSPDMIFKPS